MILTMEQTIGIASDELEEGDEDSDIEEGANNVAAATDVSKGIFVSQVFSGELGVNVSMIPLKMIVDKISISVGEKVTESLENMVWPCREKQNTCNPEEFFKSMGSKAAECELISKNHLIIPNLKRFIKGSWTGN